MRKSSQPHINISSTTKRKTFFFLPRFVIVGRNNFPISLLTPNPNQPPRSLSLCLSLDMSQVIILQFSQYSSSILSISCFSVVSSSSYSKVSYFDFFFVVLWIVLFQFDWYGNSREVWGTNVHLMRLCRF